MSKIIHGIFRIFGYNGTNYYPVRIDTITRALNTIDYAHHEVHGGSHFTYTYIDADFDIADAHDILIITPNTTVWPHMIVQVDAELDTNVQIWENTAAAGHGSAAALTAYNNDRNSATANTTTINTSDGAGADGTKIFESQFGLSAGGGATKQTAGGGSRAEQEWILKQNSKYIVRITSGTDNSSMSVQLSWYEHTNKST